MLSWPEPFVWRALFAAVGLAVIAAPLGCIVVWRRMSYVGETLAQAGLLGVALGLALHIDLTLAVVVAAIAAVGVLTLLGRQRVVPLDSALGLTHHATLALGIAAIALAKGPGIDLMSYLFGDVFAVTSTDLIWVYAGGAVVLAVNSLPLGAARPALLARGFGDRGGDQSATAARGVRPSARRRHCGRDEDRRNFAGHGVFGRSRCGSPASIANAGSHGPARRRNRRCEHGFRALAVSYQRLARWAEHRHRDVHCRGHIPSGGSRRQG